MSTRHVVLGSWRLERRPLRVGVLVIAGLVVLGIGALFLGDYPMTAGEVLGGLVGRWQDPLGQYFLTQVRAPRVVGGALTGLALGVAGAILQTISRNPLGSPDIVGLTTGAATGALVQIIVVGADTRAVALGALVGALVTAAAVYGLAWRHGVAGLRFVLVGVGIGAALAAVNSLLVVRASLVAAQTAAQWLAGSLNAVLWGHVALLGAGLALALAAVAVKGRDLAMMALPDDVAIAAGVRVQRSRWWLIVCAVVLVALATATTGPIGFVALAAPHLARLVSRTAGPALVVSGLMGAALVVASDIVAQRVLAPTQLAVGVVTGTLGGVYLVALLAIQYRRHHL